ncbi:MULTISPECIES: DNA cytosine methyltransferase [unclassified Coleofasciculus]|uniref:DNA cytosine methyltransferase n=1 Tax=unclassified Coleofasciculus TaxID=2692782 RepID=UPI0018824FE5|nr:MULTISPECIES: DNA cytosine methyltransferase [unclassified Coleofasciculus]MBE9130215.1 DNA cytosine methyltransferase [Coleofasciculus sp. LEGE 07081]MBE9152521.1 DNA cytosine methyltransferase [Coleofasciculus sp. LEGE 07092]
MSLFSGIGGLEYAAEIIGGFDINQLVEIDTAAKIVLSDRFPYIPIYSDICTYQPSLYEFDMIWGGFPCTQTSGAGKRTGVSDRTSISGAMFREFLRCVCQCKPRIVLLEQPMGFADRGLRAWVGGLKLAKYSSFDPLVIAADELGAPFERTRLFIISYPTEWEREGVRRCWNDKVREVVQRQRDQARWLAVERRGNSIVARFPGGLVPSLIAVPSNYPGRIDARKLGGQTITVPQACVALEMVKWIWSAG